jgi:hypothetical protein
LSTPTPVFTPFTKSISWTDATTASGGAPLPAGETLADTVIGIRADGDATHSAGNYQWQISVAAPASSITRADFDAAIKAAYPQMNPVPPGNYWLNGEQTDVLDGQTATSAWGTTETPFSIPVPVVAPSNPTSFVVA